MIALLESELLSLGGSTSTSSQNALVGANNTEQLEHLACQHWLNGFDSVIVHADGSSESARSYSTVRSAADVVLQSQYTVAIELSWMCYLPDAVIDVVALSIGQEHRIACAAQASIVELRRSPGVDINCIDTLADATSKLQARRDLAVVITLRRVCRQEVKQRDARVAAYTVAYLHHSTTSPVPWALQATLEFITLIADCQERDSSRENHFTGTADSAHNLTTRFKIASEGPHVDDTAGPLLRDRGISTMNWLQEHPLMKISMMRASLGPASLFQEHPAHDTPSLQTLSTIKMPVFQARCMNAFQRALFNAGVGNGGLLTLVQSQSRVPGPDSDTKTQLATRAARIVCRSVRRAPQPRLILDTSVHASALTSPSVGDVVVQFSEPARISASAVVAAAMASHSLSATLPPLALNASTTLPGRESDPPPAKVRAESPMGLAVETVAVAPEEKSFVVTRNASMIAPKLKCDSSAQTAFDLNRNLEHAETPSRPAWRRPKTVVVEKRTTTVSRPSQPEPLPQIEPTVAAVLDVPVAPPRQLDELTQSELSTVIANGLSGLQAQMEIPSRIIRGHAASPPRLASAITVLREHRPVLGPPRALDYLSFLAHEAALTVNIIPPSSQSEAQPTQQRRPRSVAVSQKSEALESSRSEGTTSAPSTVKAVARKPAVSWSINLAEVIGSTAPRLAECHGPPSPDAPLENTSCSQNHLTIDACGPLPLARPGTTSSLTQANVDPPCTNEACSVVQPPRPTDSSSDGAISDDSITGTQGRTDNVLPIARSETPTLSAASQADVCPLAVIKREIAATSAAGDSLSDLSEGYFARAVRRQLRQSAPPAAARQHPTAVYGGLLPSDTVQSHALTSPQGLWQADALVSPPVFPRTSSGRVEGWGGAPETPAQASTRDLSKPNTQYAVETDKRETCDAPESQNMEESPFFPPRRSSSVSRPTGRYRHSDLSVVRESSPSSSSAASSQPDDTSLDASRLSKIANEMRRATPVAAKLVDVLGDAYEQAVDAGVRLRGRSASARRGRRRRSTSGIARADTSAILPAPMAGDQTLGGGTVRSGERVRAHSAPRSLVALARRRLGSAVVSKAPYSMPRPSSSQGVPVHRGSVGPTMSERRAEDGAPMAYPSTDSDASSKSSGLHHAASPLSGAQAAAAVAAAAAAVAAAAATVVSSDPHSSASRGPPDRSAWRQHLLQAPSEVLTPSSLRESPLTSEPLRWRIDACADHSSRRIGNAAHPGQHIEVMHDSVMDISSATSVPGDATAAAPEHALRNDGGSSSSDSM